MLCTPGPGMDGFLRTEGGVPGLLDRVINTTFDALHNSQAPFTVLQTLADSATDLKEFKRLSNVLIDRFLEEGDAPRAHHASERTAWELASNGHLSMTQKLFECANVTCSRNAVSLAAWAALAPRGMSPQNKAKFRRALAALTILAVKAYRVNSERETAEEHTAKLLQVFAAAWAFHKADIMHLDGLPSDVRVSMYEHFLVYCKEAGLLEQLLRWGRVNNTSTDANEALLGRLGKKSQVWRGQIVHNERILQNDDIVRGKKKRRPLQ